jgi:hypothetical protein
VAEGPIERWRDTTRRREQLLRRHGLVRVAAWISERDRERLRKLAKRRKMTMNALLEDAIRCYLLESALPSDK